MPNPISSTIENIANDINLLQEREKADPSFSAKDATIKYLTAISKEIDQKFKDKQASYEASGKEYFANGDTEYAYTKIFVDKALENLNSGKDLSAVSEGLRQNATELGNLYTSYDQKLTPELEKYNKELSQGDPVIEQRLNSFIYDFKENVIIDAAGRSKSDYIEPVNVSPSVSADSINLSEINTVDKLEKILGDEAKRKEFFNKLEKLDSVQGTLQNDLFSSQIVAGFAKGEYGSDGLEKLKNVGLKIADSDFLSYPHQYKEVLNDYGLDESQKEAVKKMYSDVIEQGTAGKSASERILLYENEFPPEIVNAAKNVRDRKIDLKIGDGYEGVKVGLNPAVKSMQLDLNKLGYNLNDDGDFGELTKKAVEKFQSENRLKVTGIFDEATNEALQKAVLEKSEINLTPIVQEIQAPAAEQNPNTLSPKDLEVGVLAVLGHLPYDADKVSNIVTKSQTENPKGEPTTTYSFKDNNGVERNFQLVANSDPAITGKSPGENAAAFIEVDSKGEPIKVNGKANVMVVFPGLNDPMGDMGHALKDKFGVTSFDAKKMEDFDNQLANNLQEKYSIKVDDDEQIKLSAMGHSMGSKNLYSFIDSHPNAVGTSINDFDPKDSIAGGVARSDRGGNIESNFSEIQSRVVTIHGTKNMIGGRVEPESDPVSTNNYYAEAGHKLQDYIKTDVSKLTKTDNSQVNNQELIEFSSNRSYGKTEDETRFINTAKEMLLQDGKLDKEDRKLLNEISKTFSKFGAQHDKMEELADRVVARVAAGVKPEQEAAKGIK